MLIPLGDADGRTAWNIEAADGRRFAVFVVSGTHYVTDANCPHNRGPLAEGWIRGEHTLVCPWHWFRFDLETGECANLSRYKLRVYPVIELDGEYHADVGEPEVKQSMSDRLRAHARGED